jgi:hypothetical protein
MQWVVPRGQSLNATNGTLDRPHGDLRQRRQWRPLPPEGLARNSAHADQLFGDTRRCVDDFALWRRSHQTYGTVNYATEQHYTGKERDSESGLDYFGARYYASNMDAG